MSTATVRQSDTFAFPQPYKLPAKRKRLTVVTPRHQEGTPAHPHSRTKTNVRARSVASERTLAMSRKAAAVKTHVRLRVFYWTALVLCTAATLLLLITSLLRYNELSGMNRNIRETATQVENLRAQYDTLTMQLAPYTEASRIEELAKRRLGMQYPSKEQILSTKGDSAVAMKNHAASLSVEHRTIAASPQMQE